MNAHDTIVLDDSTTRLVRIKANQLVGRYGFTRSDREDVEQELLLDLLVRLRRFDPARARRFTFVRLVVNRCVASLIRRRRTASRDYRRANVSLDELLWDGKRAGRFLEPALDDTQQRDLRIDLTEALESLPVRYREVAEELRDGNLWTAAQQQRRTREAVRRMREHIRRHLLDRGLGDYVGFSPSVSRQTAYVRSSGPRFSTRHHGATQGDHSSAHGVRCMSGGRPNDA